MPAHLNIRDAVFEASPLERGSFVFNGGARANNHFSAERLLENLALKSRIAGYLTIIAGGFDPDALVSIDSGGDPWAEEMGKRLSVPVIHTKKVFDDDGNKSFMLASEVDEELAEQTGRKALVDDIGTTLKSAGKVLEIPTVGDSAVGMAGILFRGKFKEKEKIGITDKWLINEYIPSVINHKHRLYPHLLKGPDLRKNKRPRQ